MNCPVCNQKMQKLPVDISYNPHEDNKEYIRTRYKCDNDDAWITVELPKVSE